MSDLEIPGYRIIESVGRGGMAVVYLARQINLDRDVALKVMDRSLGKDVSFADRFVREAKMAARLNHPHIVQVYDVDSHDGLNYLTMEYIGGGDLGLLIGKQLPPLLIYDVLLQISHALDYAASSNIVHRDIKPSNILIRKNNSYVLADFGIARAIESDTNITLTGSFIGTPGYVSPEQAQGFTLDERSDFYSLAVVCFELLVGRKPFYADSSVSLALKHVSEPVPLLPKELTAYQSFFNRAMGKDPEERFQSGGEIATAFRAAIPESMLNDGSSRAATDYTTAAIHDVETQVHARTPTTPYPLPEVKKSRQRASDKISRPLRRKPKTVHAIVNSYWFFGGLLIIILLAAVGGYIAINQPKELSITDAAQIAENLAKAYDALNRSRYEESAKNFGKVMALDSNNALSKQGLAQLEIDYVAAIEEAFVLNDFIQAEKLVVQIRKYFSKNENIQSFNSRLELGMANIRLEKAQSERISSLLERGEASFSKEQLFEPPGKSAYSFFAAVAAIDAANQVAQDRLADILAITVNQAVSLTGQKRYTEARYALNNARKINPSSAVVLSAEESLLRAREQDVQEREKLAQEYRENKEQVISLLSSAREQLDKENYTLPDESNAYQTYMTVLSLDSGNEEALTGLKMIITSLLEQARAAIASKSFQVAEQKLVQASLVDPSYPGIEREQNNLKAALRLDAQAQARELRINELLAQAGRIVSSGNPTYDELVEARALYEEVANLDPDNKAAEVGITQLFDLHIAIAESEVASSDFSEARKNITAAQSLDSRSPRVLALIDGLELSEAAWVTEQTISDLNASADRQARQESYAGAVQSYREVLQIDPGNEQATSSLKNIKNIFTSDIELRISQGQLADAEQVLTTGKTLFPNEDGWAVSSKTLEDAKAAKRLKREERLSNIQSLVSQAEKLYSEGSLILPKGASAYDRYNDVLVIDPSNRQAKEGIDQIAFVFVEEANRAIADFDESKVRLSLEKLNTVGANKAVIRDLEEKYSEKQEELARQKNKRTRIGGF